jgi:hypothetical protein
VRNLARRALWEIFIRCEGICGLRTHTSSPVLEMDEPWVVRVDVAMSLQSTCIVGKASAVALRSKALLLPPHSQGPCILTRLDVLHSSHCICSGGAQSVWRRV